MGTTCITAVIGDGNVSIAHVGDSRAYLLRDGILRRLTEDHSLHSGPGPVRQSKRPRMHGPAAFAMSLPRQLVWRRVYGRISRITRLKTAIFSCYAPMASISGVVDGEAGMIQIMSRTLNAQAASEYLVDAAKRQGSRITFPVS